MAYFGVDTFTTGIYRAWFSLGDRAAAAQLAIALLAFVIAAVALERASRGERRSFGGLRGRQTSRFAPVRLTGTGAWSATVICAIPLLFGFVIPVLLANFVNDARHLYRDQSAGAGFALPDRSSAGYPDKSADRRIPPHAESAA